MIIYQKSNNKLSNILVNAHKQRRLHRDGLNRLVVSASAATAAEHVHATLKGIDLLDLGLLLLGGSSASSRGSTTGNG